MSNVRKKYLLILAFIIIIFLAIIGSSYAWIKFRSVNDATANIRACVPIVNFTGGSTINGVGLKPVSRKEDGLSKNISVNLTTNCDGDTGILNLKMKLKLFPQALAHSSFKWELYKNSSSTALATGNFANNAQGDIITMVSNEVISSTVNNYTLYLYIDGTIGKNPLTMMGQSFVIEVFGEGTGAIYNEYTMAQKSISASTDPFWGSPINANQVKSITFTSINDKPASVDGEYDLSANTIGDVVMWYVQNGTGTDAQSNTINLYDVYVASRENEHNVMASPDISGLFANLSNCTSIDARGLNTRNVTNMTNLFINDSSLTTVQLNFDTSNVTSMKAMFQGCSGFTSLDLSSFDTSKVTDLSSMFYGCTKLISLNISSFNTSNVTDMSAMFDNCHKIESIDVSGFDTSKVTTMRNMFFCCVKVSVLDLSNFNTSNVTDMSAMFQGNASLTNIIFGNNFNTANVTDMSNMFKDCTHIKSLDLSNFKTVNLANAQYTFYNMSNVETIYVSDWWVTDSITSSADMFALDAKLPNYDASVIDKTNAHYNTGGYLTYKAHA